MIRLTLKQINEVVGLAHDLHDAVRAKDGIGSRETFLASGHVEVAASALYPLGRMEVDVVVDRATVLAPLNQRIDDALSRLKALGIDFDPAG